MSRGIRTLGKAERKQLAGHFLWLMLVLSLGTGMLDAATYLGMHGVFAANMTGNIIMVGLGAVSSDGAKLLNSVLALAGFLIGATLAGYVSRNKQVAWAPRLLLASAVAVGAVALGLLYWPAVHSTYATVSLPVLGAAMGAQAVAARLVNVPDVTTVVVTSTLVLLASELAGVAGKTVDRWRAQIRGRGPQNESEIHAERERVRAMLRDAGRRGAAIGSMLVGAALGGVLLLKMGLLLPILIPAIMLLAVGITLSSLLKRAQQLQ